MDQERSVFGLTGAANPRILWEPRDDAINSTAMGRYLTWVRDTRASSVNNTYESLWNWSISESAQFWESLWEFLCLKHSGQTSQVVDGDPPLNGTWFPNVRLNYAEQALRTEWPGESVAVLSYSDTREPEQLTFGQLRNQVSAVRAGLKELGVATGDRVAGYLPNISETIVAFLATASLGAIWSSCAPEFGLRSVIDRLRQIDPKILLTADGYRYGHTVVDRRPDICALMSELPSVEAIVGIPYLDPARPISGSIPWEEMLNRRADLDFEQVSFDHPLYILFSSGTTGAPKPIVHSHGGMMLQHSKDICLHLDLHAGDRFFWYTTTGWMMWNFLISGLLAGVTIVCFDGNPIYPDPGRIWELASTTQTSFLGVSASFLMTSRKAKLCPARTYNLTSLREVGSTGSPLPKEAFEWVEMEVQVPVASSSGGTDVCCTLVGGSPLVPIWSGEISCRALGTRVEAFDSEGRSVVGREGEMVITNALPSMPVGLWGDADGSKYRSTYFDRYPGVWHHGDWIVITDRGSCIITGRSDATLNRSGVRLGTSEFYSAVEDMPEIRDSLIVHLDTQGKDELVLFVSLAPSVELDDALRSRIKGRLRDALSPRHLPDKIVAAPGIPRTLSGKKLEVPIKRLLGGYSVDAVMRKESLVNPETVDFFEQWGLRSRPQFPAQDAENVD
jgi:acetoacetyl-CoA synthetase